MSSTALFVHVPVDKIEIMSARVTSGKLFYFMRLPEPIMPLAVMAILRTKASEELFRRKLVLTRINGDWIRGHYKQLSHFTFEGTFAGQDVRGQFYVLEGGQVTGEFVAV